MELRLGKDRRARMTLLWQHRLPTYDSNLKLFLIENKRNTKESERPFENKNASQMDNVRL